MWHYRWRCFVWSDKNLSGTNLFVLVFRLAEKVLYPEVVGRRLDDHTSVWLPVGQELDGHQKHLGRLVQGLFPERFHERRFRDPLHNLREKVKVFALPLAGCISN